MQINLEVSMVDEGERDIRIVGQDTKGKKTRDLTVEKFDTKSEWVQQ